MALTKTDTSITNLQINRFETLADFQAAQAQNLIGTNDISIVKENLQPDWNQTDTTADDYIKNKPTLATVATSGSYSDLTSTPTLSTVATSGSYSDLTDKPTIGNGTISITDGLSQLSSFPANALNNTSVDISPVLYKVVTYYDLVGIIDHSLLVKGQKYRITDYITTTTYENTSSALHQFDLVVTAISESELDHRASAIPNKKDSYFTNAGADLSKWQVWYDINNDTTKYDWADTKDGTGVIYRLIDEWGNDCPYDFKNILFDIKGHPSDAYTFNLYSNSTCFDYSLNGPYCYGNVMEPYYIAGIHSLNFNVFYYTTAISNCYSNTFGNSCSYNTFGNECYNNTFGKDCNFNTFGELCTNNTFGEKCNNNPFGNSCSYNTFGNFCSYNTFGNECYSNTFGNGCVRITFGISSNNTEVGQNYYRYNIIENGNQYIRLYQTSGTAGNNNQLQNVYVAQGVNNTSTYVDISTIPRSRSYRTTVAKLSNGTIRIYKEDEDDIPNSGVLTIQSNGVTIGTFSANDANNKTVNIDGATSIGSLTDVTISTVVDGQSLVYDSAIGKWVNRSLIKVFEFNTMVPPAQIPSMIASAQAGFIVKVKIGNDYLDLIGYDATNQTIYAGKIGLGSDGIVYKSSLNGYVVTQATNDYSISYDMGIMQMELLETDDIADIAISTSTLANGDTLVYNATTQKWENGQSSGGATIEIRTWTSN